LLLQHGQSADGVVLNTPAPAGRRAHNAYGVIRRIADRVRSYGSEKHGRRSGLRPRLDLPATPDAPVARTGERALRAIRGQSPLIQVDAELSRARRTAPSPFRERVGERGRSQPETQLPPEGTVREQARSYEEPKAGGAMLNRHGCRYAASRAGTAASTPGSPR